MRRRQLLRSMLTVPGLAALPVEAQQNTDKTKPAAGEKLPPEMHPQPVEAVPKLTATSPDVVAPGVTSFFSAGQYAALTHLMELLVPSSGARPGAAEANAAPFLDFLIGHSGEARQRLYLNGLDQLEKQARHDFHKSFAELSAAESAKILSPLQTPWTYHPPTDPFAQFLVAAKEDALRATLNSREWAAASKRRRGAGVGTYWFPVEG